MACHYLDLVYWALKLSYPTAIETVGPTVHLDSTPFWLECRWEFPKRQQLPAVEVVWHHGRGCPQQVTDLGVPASDAGVLFIGDDGMLLADYNKRMLLPENQFSDFKLPEPSIAETLPSKFFPRSSHETKIDSNDSDAKPASSLKSTTRTSRLSSRAKIMT